MDCNICKTEMVNLFDSEVDETTVTDLKRHIRQCPACLQEFQQTKEALSVLKPRLQPNAPFLLKQNIMNQLKMEETKMKKRDLRTILIGSRARKIISIAAVFALMLSVISIVGNYDLWSDGSAKAANSFIESSIKATRSIKSMVIKLKVRTISHDSFSLVGTEYEMVDHTIWKSFEVPEKWRVDKGERIVVCDGSSQYLWIPKNETAVKAGVNINFTEWLYMLLEPEHILVKEQIATKDKDSHVKMEDKNGELRMTIISKAQGNFINDYRKNKSIQESDNRREYTFDSSTKLLKGLKIFIIDGEKETLIVDIVKIDYNIPLDSSLFTIKLPTGVEWSKFTQTFTRETFKDVGSKRLAELFFEGMATNNWKQVEELCDFFKGNSIKVQKIKDYFGGLEVIYIGEPFKSGIYPGEFVPYEIKFKSGQIKKFNLAVRNDHPNKIWMVDGGF